ncbi:hypothetical protein ABZX30_04000 [Streptomyces sp. NPDC004542]|uniref:hypothetical protein n=1 Tax=Streptomyces sp. NPDC004542 TaxID=3154281 RepID=UPI0033AEC62A
MTALIALVRSMVTVMVLWQRYLAPLIPFVGLPAVLTSSDSGPLAATYGSAAGAMLVCSVRQTMALIGLEDQTRRSVVIVTAGSHLRVLLGSVGTALLWCLPLTAAGPVLPPAFGKHTFTGAGAVLGVESQLTCALIGIAIGVLCSRLVFRRQGYALVTALALLLAALLGKGISPVNIPLGDLQGASGSAALVGSTGVLLTVTTAVLAATVAITQAVGVRRS